MNKISFLEVYNNHTGYGRLFARYSNIDIALKQLKKSELLKTCLRWGHENFNLEGFSHVEPVFKNGEAVIENVQVEYDNKTKMIVYYGLMEFKCYNVQQHPEIKEEGKPYVKATESKIGEELKSIKVMGVLNCDEVIYNLDGIPTYRGSLIDDNGQEVE